MEVKVICDYERYSVNRKGEVFSRAKYPKPAKKLNPWTTPNGYKMVSLSPCEGLPFKNFFVHRLIAETFIDNPNNYPIVNHKNGDKQDNRVANLEWTDAKGNARHYHKVIKPKTKRVKPESRTLSSFAISILDILHDKLTPEEFHSVYKKFR